MKQLYQNKKIIIAISILLIIVGVIVALTAGFNKELKYRDTQRIELDLGKEFEKSEMKDIVNEIIGQNNIVENINEDDDAIAIISEEITEDQKNQLISKINEKYETQIESENIQIINVPQVHLRDVIIKYIPPFLITGGIVIAYMLMRYFKLGTTKVIGITVLGNIITQCILFSIIAITRIPTGRFTIPMVITVFVFTLYGLTINFENELLEIKENNEKTENNN